MEQQIKLDGLIINYVESGNEKGDPVIILHGWGCTHSTVKFIEDSLSEKYHIYNIDLPGHGKSQEPPTAWGSEDFADIIEKFINKKEINSPSLIGHSFGGRISIILASRNNIKKIALVDAAGIKPKRSLKYYFKVYNFKLMKLFIIGLYGKKKGNDKLNRIRSKKGSADYRNSSPIMRQVMSKCVNEDLKSYMPKISSPVLLIWGEEDTATPISDALIMEKLIPDAGLVRMKGCGHYSFLDNPFLFKKVLQSFFN